MLRHKKVLIVAAIAAVVVALFATGAVPDLPSPDKVITDIATALGGWTYVLVGGLAFLETGAFVGLVAPGETTVIVGGVIAGQGEISIVPLIGLVWLCCVLGDVTSFFIGRRLGRGFLLRHGPKIRIDEHRLEQVESYFERHGGKTILIGRFIGLVRAVSPFIAGSSGLAFGRFLPFSIIGSGLWASLFCVLGFVFYRSLDRVTAVAGKATLALGLTVAMIVGAVFAYRRLRQAENRRALAAWLERQGRRPALRPLAMLVGVVWRTTLRPIVHVAVPRVRFVLDRITPGHLGLELTTALAVAGVGLYVFVLYAVMLSDDPTSTHGDRELLDVADDLHSELAVDIARIVTDFGSFATVATLVLATAVLLLVRRRFIEVAALVTGAALVYVAVRIAKEGIDRPRPERPLDSATQASFPSGHAAYSTIWIGVALLVSGAFEGLASRAALVTFAIAIAAAIGLTRIYLRVHFWSDVAGGWGLGAGILGGCAGIAIIVSYIRHNAGEPAASGGSP